MEERCRFRVEVVWSEDMEGDVGVDEVRGRRPRFRSSLYRPGDMALGEAGGLIGEEYPDLRYDVPAIARRPEEKNSE